jgi:hypothetical protein
VTYSREQIVAILTTLSETFYAETAPQIPAWIASNWENHPDALMGWVANVVPYALGENGIEPTLENLESFVGAGYKYATEDTVGLPESDQALARSIRDLSRVLLALMRLKSTAPFNPPAPSAP